MRSRWKNALYSLELPVCIAQVDLPATMPRLSKIEFTYLPQFGEYKTINGERYLNPWINYSIPKPVLVGKVSNLLCMVL